MKIPNTQVIDYSCKNGIRHINLKNKDSELFFLIGFSTQCKDNSGVFHALEHLLMSSNIGSISMLSASKQLNIDFLNGTTTNDTTYYYFRSSCKEDFEQMIALTINALFFPLFSDKDFQRELFSFDLKVKNGVVLNEMIGALNSPSRVVWEEVKKALFSNTPKQFNSGGNIEALYQLDLDEINNTHKDYYTPNNCVILTKGPTTGKEYHTLFESFESFKQKKKSIEADFISIKKDNVTFDCNVTEDTYIVAWELENTGVKSEYIIFDFMYELLMGNAASYLNKELFDNNDGIRVGKISGYQSSFTVPTILISLHCKNHKSHKQVYDYFKTKLINLINGNIHQKDIDLALCNIEIKYSDIYGGSNSNSVSQLLPIMTDILNGREYIENINPFKAISQIRTTVTNKDYIISLITKQLIYNPRYIVIIAKAQRSAVKKPKYQYNLKNSLPDVLNKTSSIIPLKLKKNNNIKKRLAIFKDHENVRVYNESFGNLCHYSNFINISSLDINDICYLQYFSQLLPSGSNFITPCHVNKTSRPTDYSLYIQKYGKFLLENSEDFFYKINNLNIKALSKPMFNVLQARREYALSGNGVGFALAQVDSRSSTSAWIRNKMSGLDSFSHLKDTIIKIQKNNFEEIHEAFKRIQNKIDQAANKHLLIVPPKNTDILINLLQKNSNSVESHTIKNTSINGFTLKTIRQWWYVDSPTYTCAVSYVVFDDVTLDTYIELLAIIIHEHYIHPIIREHNGAYFTSVQYNKENGTLNFSSSRTLSPEKDIEIMCNALLWFVEEFNSNEFFENHKRRWIYSNGYQRQTPTSQFTHFYQTVLQVDIDQSMKLGLMKKVSLQELKKSVIAKLLYQPMSCVVTGREVSGKLLNKYNMESKY